MAVLVRWCCCRRCPCRRQAAHCCSDWARQSPSRTTAHHWRWRQRSGSPRWRRRGRCRNGRGAGAIGRCGTGYGGWRPNRDRRHRGCGRGSRIGHLLRRWRAGVGIGGLWLAGARRRGDLNELRLSGSRRRSGTISLRRRRCALVWCGRCGGRSARRAVSRRVIRSLVVRQMLECRHRRRRDISADKSRDRPHHHRHGDDHRRQDDDPLQNRRVQPDIFVVLTHHTAAPILHPGRGTAG